MARIEDAFLINTDAETNSPTTPQFIPAMGAEVKAQMEDKCKTVLTSQVCVLSRTARITRDLHCGRTVPDADLLQHREDCRFLMEVAHDRFLITGEPQDLADARMWMHRMHEAIQRLSPEWKAAREAQECETFTDLAEQRIKQ
jgi:hypothetical protein